MQNGVNLPSKTESSYVFWGLSELGPVGRASPRQEDPGLIPGPLTFFSLLVVNYSTFHGIF